MIRLALAASRASVIAALVGSLLTLPALAQVTLPGTTGAAPSPAVVDPVGTRAGDEAPGVLGEPQSVDVDVGADVRISSIVLFHRFAGEDDFETTPMRARDEPGLYSATVPTSGTDAAALEFYVLAEDASGDTLFKGSAFAPIVRELRPAARATSSAPPMPVAGEPGDAPEPGPGGRRYLYYALGALAVGAAIAAASSGGDGGSDDDGCADGRCGLTIALPEP